MVGSRKRSKHTTIANERVSAIAMCRSYYNSSTLQADKVIYDQTNKRRCGSNVRLDEPDARITYANPRPPADDFRDGFVRLAHTRRSDQPASPATRCRPLERQYHHLSRAASILACEAVRGRSHEKPPKMQSRRPIIHDQDEKMVYFESAARFFGGPLAWLPYFRFPILRRNARAAS